ncbi:MAG: 4'-phosphopantetheinyl transferase superfamily protein [Ruminococcus sp.]|nr:4'-phosphopantetheinyl transferase superfamily protein [Ruminococcus sp.]
MLLVSLKSVPKKEQRLHAHNLLRECLKTYNIEYTADKTPITRNDHGKPSLAGHPEIKYNLSHAEGIAVCLVADTECGVDCEGVRPYRPNVVRRSFSENEKTMIENAPQEEKDLLFFRLWTLKEAYVKAIGIGISYPLNTVEFAFDGRKIISNIKGYRFRQYILRDGKFIIAVCTEK